MLKPSHLLSSLPFLMLPLVAAAQQGLVFSPNATASEDGRHELKFGSVTVVPKAALRLGRDDNLTQAPGTPAQPVVSSAFWLADVGVTADLAYKGDRYSLEYLGAFTRYTSSSTDNTEVHNLQLQGVNVLTTRNAVRWQAGLVDGYDPRGSTDATTAVLVPSHFRTYRAGGTYSFGAAGAKGRLEGDAFFSTKEYLNNRAVMATADVDTTEVNGRFFWRVMPKTSAVLDVRFADFDYVAANAGLDSTSLQLLVGANWDATAATSGSFRVGHTSRRYDERDDFSGLSWEAGVTWKPLTYSSWTLTTGRNVTDTNSGATATVGDYVLATQFGVNWAHLWRPNLRTELAWTHVKSDYRGILRLDKQDNLKAGVYYGFRSWLSAGFEVSQTDRRSTLPEFNFKRLQTMAVLRSDF